VRPQIGVGIAIALRWRGFARGSSPLAQTRPGLGHTGLQAEST
jgi:hypothetical protein